MKVYDSRLGRLGNAIFRYFASSLFCIIYGAKRTYNMEDTNNILNDSMFINWMNNILNDNIPNINDYNYNFYGYYQHDKIFIKFKNELLLWMKNNQNESIYTDGNDEFNNNYNYNVQFYKVAELITKPIDIPIYDVVIHIRLEDFINNNDVIHPDCIIKILDELSNDKKYISYCLVLNKPKTDIENAYINYINSKYKINIHCETVIKDFHVMKNSKVLICSCSTLSWIASFLSETIEIVYFPNKKKENHESFCKPIKNTKYYNIIKCSKDDLSKLFNLNNTTAVDTFCIQNYKGEPITNLVLEYIKNIKNGFYVEIGAYDGIFQSSTKFIEDNYNWKGILIEPSPTVFLDLEKNRPNNILINKCIVSNKYDKNIISGAFDCGPMSSVNNIRNIPNVKLIDVECDNLSNILDIFTIIKIDLLSINTEGYEYEVLEGINFNKYKPTYLLITIYRDSKDKVFDFIDNKGYIFLENITNYNIFDNPNWDKLHNTFLFKSL